MRDFIVVGMTGPTGSGKSTVGRLLCEKGFKIIDADKVARRVTEKGSPTLSSLCSAFGEDILRPDGELDRPMLAKKAFADRQSLEKLNSITHPAIIDLIEREISSLRESGETKIILDAPQLFEAGAEKMCDFVLSVLADKETRIERIKSRDNITDEQAQSRINAQKSDEFFVENSDFVIYNNSDIEALTPQVDLLISKITEVQKVGADFDKCQPFSTDPETQAKIEQVNKRPSPKKRIAFLGAVGVCVVAIAVVIIILLSGGGYTKVIEKSLKLYKNPSVETIKEIYPEQMWDFLLTDRYSVIDSEVDSVDDIIERYLLAETQEISNQMSQDFGEDWRFEYEVISEQKLDGDTLAQISGDLKKATNRELNVKKAYKINLSYTIIGEKTTENFVSFTAVKIDSDWYVVENYVEMGWRITVLEY